jgi:branched-chain amino acid transport system substrate-binding protein
MRDCATARRRRRDGGAAPRRAKEAPEFWKYFFAVGRGRERMRKILMASMACAAAWAAAASAKAADLTIAVAGPMTGPVATIGEQMKRGAEAAAAAINEAGGVNGRTIKIVVEDDQCDPKQAVAVANRIVGEQIKFVDGHACSGSSIPAAEVYSDNKVLMMSPASSNPVLTEKGYTTIMRLYGRDDAQGAFIAPWIAEKYKDKKIAVLHDKSAYGQGLATVVKTKLNQAGVKEALFDGINPGEKDYSAIVSKLKSLGVEFIYFGGYHTEAGLILRQASDQGYKPTLMTGDSIATPEYWAISGPAGEGTLFTFPTDPRRSPAAAKALAQFKAQNFEPEGFTLFSYGVVQAIAEGIKRAGSDDPAKVAKALEDGTPVSLVMGPVKFDAKGDIADPRYDINVWHEGKYAPLAQ